ncbi:MAG TPA: anthranilate phosphoribosyltransferase [Ilumatobacter sp.]|nr:anthranilate phosphoribosyltransferase [Ilumatobacter sp.]
MATIDDHGGWPALLTHLLDRNHLTAEQAQVVMATILSGEATTAQIVAFLVALRAKGESADELGGLLEAVLEYAALVPLTDAQRDTAIDIVGTGGDRSHSINVSTMAALVCAGAGAPVLKHGNRGASSKCGAADVLEALGVAIELTPDGARQALDRAGIAFCLAPAFHPAFRHAGPPRREIGIPTVFNVLGPMANPGRLRRYVIGVANAAFAERMVETLRLHGATHVWVVHGEGLDELSTTGPSHVVELRDGAVRRFDVDATAYGFATVTLDALEGGDPARNADVVRAVLGGQAGPHRDIVVLNAAAGLVVAGLADDLADGVGRAAAAIDSGAATAALERLVAESQAAVSA